MITELILLQSELNEIKLELKALRAENDRLKRGEFTPEEINNFCHDFPSNIVSPIEFAHGCKREMLKLYGTCPFEVKDNDSNNRP